MTERRTSRIIGASILLLVAGAAIAVLLLRPWESWAGPSADGKQSELSDIETAPVERATLTGSTRLNGQLSYGTPVPLAAAGGIITALPAAGQTIDIGEQLYESDGRPVVLLTGARPLWRELASDMSEGPDVQQLEQNLATLGFFVGEPDTHFDWWTKVAIMDWQEALGLERTGIVRVSDAVFVNTASIRVDQITANLGATGVSPFTYSETSLRVTAKLSAAQLHELEVPKPVTVKLPTGTEIEATMTALDPGSQPGKQEGETTPPTAIIEFPDQAALAGEAPGSVKATISNDQAAAETLVVPAVSVLATGKDRYAVEVVKGKGEQRRIVRVPVLLGLAVDGRVQVLASGASVEGTPKDAPQLNEGDQAVTAR